MSRGLGRIQREVLAALADLGSTDVRGMATRIFGWPVITGTSQYETVRRALRSLERRGLVRDRRERVQFGPEPILFELSVVSIDTTLNDDRRPSDAA